MTQVRIEVKRGFDELGEPEEFTWDLFPVVNSSFTTHLDRNGLPKKGTVVTPGMILVGKIGKSHMYDPGKQPTSLETEGLEFSELAKRYGPMWCNTSFYASAEHSGVVGDAWIEDGPQAKAVVIVESW